MYSGTVTSKDLEYRRDYAAAILRRKIHEEPSKHSDFARKHNFVVYRPRENSKQNVNLSIKEGI